MLYKRLILAFIISIVYITTLGQSCKNYKWEKCDGYGPPYKYSGQSKSAYFEKGQKSSFSINVYGGFEYSIRICTDKNLKDIYFRLREDGVNKKIIYDSSTENIDYLEIQFYVENTKKLILEVIAPESDDPENEKYEDRTGCVGVLIEYYKAPRRGF